MPRRRKPADMSSFLTITPAEQRNYPHFPLHVPGVCPKCEDFRAARQLARSAGRESKPHPYVFGFDADDGRLMCECGLPRIDPLHKT